LADLNRILSLIGGLIPNIELKRRMTATLTLIAVSALIVGLANHFLHFSRSIKEPWRTKSFPSCCLILNPEFAIASLSLHLH
jgi:hypothetical protein